MRNSRREFLQATSAAALSLTALGRAAAQTTATPTSEKSGSPQPAGSQSLAPEPIQVPRIKFGGVEISRMVLGVNPLYGWSHFNLTYSSTMSEWYTPDRVCALLHQANRLGINAFNYANAARAPHDLARFQSEGGKMHLIAQIAAPDDVTQIVHDLKPLAVHRQGEAVDIAFQQGRMDSVRDWCKLARDLGILVGVGTHKPEVIELVEEQGWDVDFYAGCVYNRTRTQAEWQKLLGGELLEMPREIYLQSDPPRMYKVMRQTSKPCFAFKILAAGRIADADVPNAFRTALQSIKPNDGIFVGVFPRRKDEIRENAQIMHNLAAGA